MASPPDIEIEVFGKTDVGLVREHNEDNFIVADVAGGKRSSDLDEALTFKLGDKGALFLVCDGMGGAAAGEVASQMAVDSICDSLTEAGPLPRDLFARLLRRAVEKANERIFIQSRDNQSERGMGTTCTAAALVDNTLVVAQIGDSRCYVFRAGALGQVTKDQSLAWQLIEAGAMTAEEAKAFEHANIILQALGVQERVEVVLSQVDLRRGDVVLLCSDGLHGPVGDDEIQDILKTEPDLKKAGAALIAKALEHDGPDNVTVVLARAGGTALPEPKPEDTVKFVAYDPGRDPEDETTPGAPLPPGLASENPTVADVPVATLQRGYTAVMPAQAAPGAPATVADAAAPGAAPDLRPRTSLVTFVLLALLAIAAGGLFVKCDNSAGEGTPQTQAP